jgi:hypothetical protein
LHAIAHQEVAEFRSPLNKLPARTLTEFVTIMQVVSIIAIEKVPLHERLAESMTRNGETGFPIQLEFCGL